MSLKCKLDANLFNSNVKYHHERPDKVGFLTSKEQ